MASAGPGLQGSRVPGPSSQAARSRPCRCTPSAPLQAPPRKPPSGPSSVLGGFERGLSEVFKAAPPRAAFKGHTPLHPSTRATAAAPGGAGKEWGGVWGEAVGRPRLRGPSTAQKRQARPRALGDPLPSPTSEEAQADSSCTAPATGGGGGGGGGEGRGGAVGRGRETGRGKGTTTLPGFLC